jgi:hypothetical protein
MVEGLTTFQHLAKGQGLGPNRTNWQHDEIEDLDFKFGAPRSLSAMASPITIQQQDPGDTSGEAIPVPIPNTAVKLSRAEDTERAAFRENRSSPGFCASCGPAILPER